MGHAKERAMFTCTIGQGSSQLLVEELQHVEGNKGPQLQRVSKRKYVLYLPGNKLLTPHVPDLSPPLVGL